MKLAKGDRQSQIGKDNNGIGVHRPITVAANGGGEVTGLKQDILYGDSGLWVDGVLNELTRSMSSTRGLSKHG